MRRADAGASGSDAGAEGAGNAGGGAAIMLFPCTLDELFAVADANKLMPPKSTWFDPKPRSGLFVYPFSPAHPKRSAP
jgi:hypothetical protein